MRILIVDDEYNICLALRNIFADDGHTGEIVQNPKSALAMIAKDSPDIVILDVSMPEISGLEVLERIKAIDETIQVIMISGHSGISEAVRAIKSGAFDFLEKPLSLPKVKLTVSKALEFRTLTYENERLKNQFFSGLEIIGDSQLINDMRKLITKAAPTNSKVLIRGESGTGKELVAYAIHSQSNRSRFPFIKFNSAAIPTELVESELFGFEKGAFTGALKSKKGKLEEADKGSLFLDEIGDMSLSAQAKILRVIQEGEFERVGSNKKEKIDTRIIAATHKNLEEMIEKGTFREDLYYRLNVIPIVTPPLREHSEDLPLLIEHYSHFFQQEMKTPAKIFANETIEAMKKWDFPGNVRELKNLIERVYIMIEDTVITPEQISNFSGRALSTGQKNSLGDSVFWKETVSYAEKKREFEKRYLLNQLEQFNYNVSQTSYALGLHPGNLSRKIKELGLETENI